MTLIGNIVCSLGVAAIAVLVLGAGVKVTKWSIEEAQREELRRQTERAMRTDRHLARLRKQGMRVKYREARVW